MEWGRTVVDGFYLPPPGEYVRHQKLFRIDDPRGEDSFDTHFVRGARYHEPAFKTTHDGQELDLELVPEPGNPHDKWAVALHIAGTRIGYIGTEFASMWQDIVVAINLSGKTVVAAGLIDDAHWPSATVFLPWLRWDREFGPDYSEECDALLEALDRDQQRRVLSSRLESLGETDIYLLQSLAALAPSLNWRSQGPGRTLPLQLEWHLIRRYRQNGEEKLAAQNAVRQLMREEVHRKRTTEGATFTAIAAELGCSPSTASKRYREYIDGLTD